MKRINGHSGPVYRRTAIVGTSLVLALLCTLHPSCSKDRPFTKESFLMGTRVLITIYGLDHNAAQRAAREAMRELHRVESVMSTWKEDSEISRLNRESKGEPYHVSNDLFTLVDSSLYYSKITSGAFDITARPLVRLWGFQGGEEKLPTDEEIVETRAVVGYTKITLDRAASTITLPVGMSLDLAGIAKGYGVDRAADVLKAHGASSALVNLGGNIYAIGSPPGKEAWTIGIRDPKGTTDVVGTLQISDEAVATSGNYENFRIIEGTAYGHIIDPRTGWPVDDVLSVTAVAPTALASDALSTGLFVLGPEDGTAIVVASPAVKALFAVPDGPGISYTRAGDFGGNLLLREETHEK
ncbi:MAG: FAD:protein FMN transferase [bacterium]|nr:MAG: FAD:protein FMN transferase [bacterium]